MRTHLHSGMVVVLLVGTLGYAIAEEITLTTYYPSPRGVYNELRTAGNVQIGSIEPPADPATAPRFHVVLRKDTDPATTAPALLIEDKVDTALATPRDESPFVIDSAGNVGIGTPGPLSKKLEVAGGIQGTELCLGAACRASWLEVVQVYYDKAAIWHNETTLIDFVTVVSRTLTLTAPAQVTVIGQGNGSPRFAGSGIDAAIFINGAMFDPIEPYYGWGTATSTDNIYNTPLFAVASILLPAGSHTIELKYHSRSTNGADFNGPVMITMVTGS